MWRERELRIKGRKGRGDRRKEEREKMEAHGGHLGMKKRVIEKEEREQETWACLGRGWGDE